jgi:hypothetical protein
MQRVCDPRFPALNDSRRVFWTFNYNIAPGHQLIPALAPVLGRASGNRAAPSGEVDEDTLFRAPDVQAAFRRLKESPAIEPSLSTRTEVKRCARIQDHEIVLDEALSLAEAPEGVRFLAASIC